jgi:hypothetical protein
MMLIQSFAATAATWQNFYLLTGTAAATLIGLMFVAVTFGSTIMTQATSSSGARAFLDPTFSHFVQVLVTACLMAIPSLGPTTLGALLLAICLLRTSALNRVYREMKAASDVHHDIELSDWLMGIVLPLLCHALLGATGAAFIKGYAMSFEGLAIITVVILLNGIYGAWELMVWLAVTRNKAK